MPVNRLPLLNLTQPPLEFKTLEEVNRYLIELHRDIENQHTNIDTVISLNYVDTSTDLVFGGDIEVDDSDDGLILESPDGTRWRVQVDNSGNLTTTSL
jgi:hypothetical protein